MKFTELQKERFLDLYQRHSTTLNDHQRAGLLELLTAISADNQVTDPRQIAYMLATCKHETADTFLPISEYGRGQGKKYGKPNPHTGLVYYGRGYTQNTWENNYLMLTNAWNRSHPDRRLDFVAHPDLLLVPEYSYWAMSYAMSHGAYTGVSLNRYINDQRCDYRLARQTINGLDCADRIASYADLFEQLLEECLNTAAAGDPDPKTKGGENNGRKNA